jgi:hypothetical protein
MKPGRAAFLVLLPMILAGIAHADDSVEPYINSIRQEMREQGQQAEPAESGLVDPYIQQQKEKLAPVAPESPDQQSYIDQVRKEDPAARPPGSTPSYSDQQKAKLPPASPGGAIEAFHAGKDELHARKEGPIRFAGGFRLATVLNRDITAAGSTINFTQLYGSKWVPDFTIFFEYQPWHSEFWGNFGLFGQAGFSQHSGEGQFAVNLPKPWGGTFGSTSRTQFRFLSYPFTGGLSYRFNLLRILRPYIQAGPTIIGYNEMRFDHRKGHRGYSTGYTIDGGVNLKLDWLSKELSWDLYQEAGVKQYYLTVDYVKLVTVAGPVDFDVSGFSVGFTYEF